MSAARHQAGRQGDAGLPRFDGWLRLDPATETRHEAQTGRARAYFLRHIIWFGLVLYNIYIVTGILLTPDIAWQAAVLRLLVVTPVSLVLAWGVVHLAPVWRERLTLLAMFNAHLLPVALFAATRSDLGGYTFGELTLTLVYGNMLMALRFRHAVMFTAAAVAVTLLALWIKPGMPPALMFAMAVQILTAGVFSLTANYLMEWRRCRDYVTAVTAELRAERAEVSQLHLAEMSRTDALTGLPNRRHLDDTLAAWCAGPGPVAVLMIDVDHFKLYNDALGHPAGDDCLRRLAQVFRDALPRTDAFCARFGGEEFTIALRGPAPEAAVDLAHSIVDRVRSQALPHPGRTDRAPVVTVSVGLAAARGVAPAELMARSDAALYQAKRGGRDRVEVFAPPRIRPARSA